MLFGENNLLASARLAFDWRAFILAWISWTALLCRYADSLSRYQRHERMCTHKC